MALILSKIGTFLAIKKIRDSLRIFGLVKVSYHLKDASQMPEECERGGGMGGFGIDWYIEEGGRECDRCRPVSRLPDKILRDSPNLFEFNVNQSS